MTQVLERQRTEYYAPVRRRSPVLAYTLITVGALVALVGVYFQFAPTNWWLAHFSEVYHYGSYIAGGLFLASGLGVYANWAMKEDDRTSTRVAAATVLAVLALAVVVGAALELTL